MQPTARHAWVLPATLLALLLVAGSARAAPPQLDAAAWIVIDASDGAVLTASREHDSVPIASATKIMTARIVLRELKLEQEVTATRYEAGIGESVLGLQRGERITVHDLLYALLLPSANDAAFTLAKRASGGVKQFVRAMNDESSRLGLDDTHYASPVGLDSTGNYSSAADLASLARVDLRDREFRKIVDTASITLESGAYPRTIESRNSLLFSYPWVNGVKTGYTAGAGNVLVASGRRDGVELISVVLDAPTEAARDADSLALLEWGFGRYSERTPLHRSKPVASVAVRYRDDEPLQLRPEHSLQVRARDDQRITRSFDIPAVVEGPIDPGKRIGSVSLRIDGRDAPIATVGLVAAAAVEAPGLLDRHGRILGFLAIALGVPAGLLCLWWLRYRSRREQRQLKSREARAMARRRAGIEDDDETGKPR